MRLRVRLRLGASRSLWRLRTRLSVSTLRSCHALLARPVVRGDGGEAVVLLELRQRLFVGPAPRHEVPKGSDREILVSRARGVLVVPVIGAEQIDLWNTRFL